MGRLQENPRYHVVSVRMSDSEHEAYRQAKDAGLSAEGVRKLILSGATDVLARAAEQVSCEETTA